MENADKQLKKLGYRNIGKNYYKNRFDSHIYFREDMSIDVSGRGGSKNKEIPLEQLQAIITKAYELGWLKIDNSNELLTSLLRQKDEEIEKLNKKCDEYIKRNKELADLNRKLNSSFKRIIQEIMEEYYGKI